MTAPFTRPDAALQQTARTVLFDTTCFKDMVKDQRFQRFTKILTARHQRFVLTASNIVELAANGDAHFRQDRLRVAAKLAGVESILPEPRELLRAITEAAQSGATECRLPPSGYEAILSDPNAITDAQALEQRQVLNAQDVHFDKLVQDARELYQPHWRQWPNVESFLGAPDGWKPPIDAIWKWAGLTGPPRVDIIQEVGSWRLFLDALGALTYHRSVSRMPVKTIRHRDIQQVVYLGGPEPRIFLTADKPLRDLLVEVTTTRHPSAGSATLCDFIAGS